MRWMDRVDARVDEGTVSHRLRKVCEWYESFPLMSTDYRPPWLDVESVSVNPWTFSMSGVRGQTKSTYECKEMVKLVVSLDYKDLFDTIVNNEPRFITSRWGAAHTL